MSSNDPIIEFLDNLIVEVKQFFKDAFFNLAILVSIITFVVNATSTPTTSMYPTIKKGDWFLLLKCAYGFNLHSFDMGPMGISHNYFWKNLFTYFTNKKILALRKITPGDVISFRINGDLNTGFLKRIIAVGGQTVQMIGGHLYIDGKPVEKRFIRSKDTIHKKDKITYLYYEETLPNGKKHITRYIKGQEFSPSNNTTVFFIPHGFCFAMGDNRDNSDDSRGNIGLIPEANIFGKGFVIFFSKSSKLSLFTLNLKKMFTSLIKLPKKIKWKRIFTIL
jgi:signal peptidase I